MIKYRLNCKKCNYIFDSWFASSKEFEKIKKIKLLNCSKCNSNKVDKSLMSPNLNVSENISKSIDKSQYNKIKSKLIEYQKFIKKNFEYVGNNFAYKARSIHFNKKKQKKGIYGNASYEEIKELKEEGIDTQVIPWIDNKNH